MNNMNMETEKSSRKKLLVPLVVLLLCAVSLTGAAYAYSATLTNNSNSADAGVLSVDLKTGTPTESNLVFSGTNVVTFTDNFNYTKSGNPATWQKTNQVGYSLKGGDVVTYVIDITREEGNTATVDLTIDVEGLDAITIPVNDTPTALTSLFDVKVKIGTAEPVALDSSDPAKLTKTFTGTAIGEKTIVISFTTKVTPTEGYVTAYPEAASLTNLASYYKSQIDSGNFKVVFTAESSA